jgi:dethiobiotin synthetase
MSGLFIAATGTDIGKTYLTAGLVRAARRARHEIAALKPVLTGFDPKSAEESDVGQLIAALGREVTPQTMQDVAPFRFALPLSPHLAAAAEQRSLELAEVVAACRTALAANDLVLIEGIGGVMVPLSLRETQLDLIAALDLPVVLVTGSYLGALSHCLTALSVLRAAGCPARCVIVNESAASTVRLDDTVATLVAFAPDAAVQVVKRDADDETFDHLYLQLRLLVTEEATTSIDESGVNSAM